MTYSAKPQYHAEPPITRIAEDGPNSMVPVDYDPMAHGRMWNEVATLADWTPVWAVNQIEDLGI